MSRATRSRQALVSLNPQTDSKQNTIKTSSEKTTTGRVTRKNVNGKNISDENSSLPIKSGRVSKNSQLKKSVLGIKLHASKKDDSTIPGNKLLAMKSPVLRDRTNTTNELVKVDASTKKTEEVNFNEKKKSVKATRSTRAVKSNAKLSSEVQVSMEKFVVKKQKVQKENSKEQKAEESEKINKKHTIGSTFNKIISRKNSDLPKVNKGTEYTESIDNEDNGEIQKLSSDIHVQSKNENSNINRVSRRKNISIEAVEQLINKDEDIEFVSDRKDSQKCSKVEKIANAVTETGEENKKVNKKFFRNKGTNQEIKTVPVGKKFLRGKINKRKRNIKKIEADDSSFNLALEEQRQSTKPSEKELRPRENKNYCEVSKLSQESNSNEDKSIDAEKNKDLKKIPIYKTIQLSQENIKDKAEIYDYLDDSQEDRDQKGKKGKTIGKKPAVKRAKKTATSKATMGQKIQKKITKKVPSNRKSKVQKKEPINMQQTIIVNNMQTNIIIPKCSEHIIPEHFSSAEDNVQTNVALPEFFKQAIPEHLLNAGDSTIAEASTIKILSDKQLEGSNRINLTSTPPVPKTITSELKLFGPKNVITSKPTAKYSNMVNHSLIRKSMSPITKVVENFDTGSPWRAADAFSRVNRVVQSTPQINRLPSMREKKLTTHISDWNKKALNSEDTIHISSFMDDKSLETKEKSTFIPITNQNDVSLRKFGTVISNLSPVKSVNSSNSPVQNNLQSSVQAAPSLLASSEIPLDQEGIIIPAIHDKENMLTSPTKSPRKKISTPSPFRFEKIRASKRIASIESESKMSTPVKLFEEVEPEPGPSCLDKPKPSLLRQSNLNNFLNLDEMPESTRISTAHGIFNDIHSTPIAGKKPKYVVEEPNIDNAFGFDDSDTSKAAAVMEKSSGSVIATEQDVRDSVKGKLFPKARVKSLMPSRISQNTVKKILLNNVFEKKNLEKKRDEILNQSDTSDSEREYETIKKDVKNNNACKKTAKETALDAVSFSDTFDVFSENRDIQSRVPEEIPLFVDLEPVHFTKPPRRSYNKRKRAVNYNTSKEDSASGSDDDEKPKSKKKKVSKLNKQENKRMQEWLKNINKTFEEIEHYDLVVE